MEDSRLPKTKQPLWPTIRAASTLALALAFSPTLALADQAGDVSTQSVPPAQHQTAAELQANTAPSGELSALDLYRLQVPTATLTQIGVEPLRSPNPTQTAYLFFNRMFIFLGGLSLSSTVKTEIDSTVHNPWLLTNDTAKWRDQFEYNENRFAASILANAYPSMAAYSPARLRWDPSLSPYTIDDAVGFTKSLVSQVASSIQPDVAIDYGVNRLVSLPGYPRSEEAWHKTENAVADNAVPIGLGVLAAGAAADLGALAVGGNPIHIHGKEYNLGWHAAVDHLGVSLTPNLRAGPSFSTAHGIEASAGIVEHVNSAANAEATGFETYEKIPILRAVDGARWEVGLFENGHYYWRDGNRAEAGRFKLSSDLYFKENDFLGTGRINQLIGDINYTTNFATQQSLTASIGLADFNTGTSVALYARLARDSLVTANNISQLGVFLSGTWESMTPIARGNIFLAVDRVTRALDELKANRDAEKACAARLKSEPTTELSQAARVLKANSIQAECRELAQRSSDDRATLEREFKDLLRARDVAFMREGRESRNAISDWDGPLAIETMREIRAEIDLPEYDAPPRQETLEADAAAKKSLAGRAPASSPRAQDTSAVPAL